MKKNSTFSKRHIITDSREKKNGHILSRFDEMGIPYTTEKMDAGDYSFYYNGKDYRDEFIIERKANWLELYGNLVGSDRNRIKREFQRLEKVPYVVLLIEDVLGMDGISLMKMNNYKMDRNRLRIAFSSFVKYRDYERKKMV